MPAKSFVSKTKSKNSNLELEPKEYNSLEDYLKDQEPVFKELLEYFDNHYSRANALRTLNKVEKDLDIIATASQEGSLKKGQISEIKANFMLSYTKEHLSTIFAEETLSIKSFKLDYYHIIDHLNQKFGLGDEQSNFGGGLIYIGEGAKALPEHVDIREALDDQLFSSVRNICRSVINRFFQTKNVSID